MLAVMRKRNRKKTTRRSRFSLSRLRLRLAGAASAMLSLAGLLVVGFTCLWAVAWVLDAPITKVEVGGQFQRVAPVQIEQAVAPFRGAGFLSVDLRALQASLERVAWVDRARVERKWPGALRVLITEHVPAARWGEDGLMNTRGELFLRGVRHVPPELPQLVGPEGTQEQVAKLYLETYPRLLALGLRLTRVELDARGAWELTVGEDVTVRLGRKDVDSRLDRFIEVAGPMLAARASEVSYVDLRYSNGFAVGWNETSTRLARDGGPTTAGAWGRAEGG